MEQENLANEEVADQHMENEEPIEQETKEIFHEQAAPPTAVAAAKEEPPSIVKQDTVDDS